MKRCRRLALALGWLAGVAMAQAPDRGTPIPSTVVVQKDVTVMCRDGVRPATDLFFPARDGVRLSGRFPVIVERTPYNK